jgi:hypothetical protein
LKGLALYRAVTASKRRAFYRARPRLQDLAPSFRGSGGCAAGIETPAEASF